MPTILIVDDEPAFLDILEMILRRFGYTILMASNGREALRMIQTYRPHLVLIDDMLPDISGGEICSIVKNDFNLQHIPMVLFSAGARVRDPRYIECIRADGTLMKPFRSEDVLRIVRSCLPTMV